MLKAIFEVIEIVILVALFEVFEIVAEIVTVVVVFLVFLIILTILYWWCQRGLEAGVFHFGLFGWRAWRRRRIIYANGIQRSI